MVRKIRNFDDFLINVIEWDIYCYSGVLSCKDKGKRYWKGIKRMDIFKNFVNIIFWYVLNSIVFCGDKYVFFF